MLKEYYAWQDTGPCSWDFIDVNVFAENESQARMYAYFAMKETKADFSSRQPIYIREVIKSTT